MRSIIYTPLGSEGDPCLFTALSSVEITRALLEKGANPNIPSYSKDGNRTEYAAIFVACENPEVVELLKQYGAS